MASYRGKDDYTLFMPLTSAQEINIQNMNIELVAQMFKNYQNNVFFNLEGTLYKAVSTVFSLRDLLTLMKQRLVN